MLSTVALLTALSFASACTDERESSDRPPAGGWRLAGAPAATSTLRVVSTSASATVWVDGARRDSTPAELRLAPGRHQVVLVAPAGDSGNGGYFNRRESVGLAAGATREIRVDLARKEAGRDTSSTSNPADSGSWSGVRPWPVIAVNAHLLPNGKVLAWEEGEAGFNPGAGEITGFSKASVWDPETDRFTDVRNATTNVFAGGHAFLPDSAAGLRRTEHP